MAAETADDGTPSDSSDDARRATPVHLGLFGEPSVLVDNKTWIGRAAQNRRLAVLVVLAAAPSRRMMRPAIQALLWPDADIESSRRLLNEAVYVIRKELGGGVLETRGEYLQLGAGVTSDVEVFRAAIASGELEHALRQYTGPFLGSWTPSDMPEFERWASLERGTLARQHRDTILRLAARFETAGDWVGAVERYQQLLDVDPLSVQAAVGLSHALAALGEPLRGLKVVDTIANRWREEFGEQFPASLNTVRDELLSMSATIVRPVSSLLGRQRGEPTLRPDAEPVTTAVATVFKRQLALMSSLKRIRRGVLLGGLALAAISVLALGPGLHRTTSERIRTSRLAIAPFDMAPADSDVAFIATGLGESLAGALGTLTGLQLIAPEALTGNAGVLPSLDSIARRFGEPLLIRGTVEHARDEVSVTVRIIDSRTGEQVASSVATASAGQLASLRQEFVARVAVAVRQRIGFANERDVHDAWERLGIATAEGVELTWRAQHRIRAWLLTVCPRIRSGSARERVRRAGEEADSLLALAERSSPQWREPTLLRARLAWERARLEVGPARLAEATVGIGHAERAIAMLEAEPVRRRAVGEAPRVRLESSLRREQLAQAHFLRGTLRLMTGVAMATWRSENGLISGGEQDLERAVELDSMLAAAWAGLARPRWIRADFTGAYGAAQKAVQVDPFGQSLEESINWAARSAAALGDRDGTLRWCRRGRTEVPSTWRFLDCELLAYQLDAAGMGRTPDPISAWALVDTLERMDANAVQMGRQYSPIYRRLTAAAVSAAAGDSMRARDELQRARARVAGHSDMEVDIKYDAALVYLALRDTAQARVELVSLKRRDRTMPRGLWAWRDTVG